MEGTTLYKISQAGNMNKNLMVSFGEFYKNGDFSDVSLACEGQLFNVHKIMLAAHSIYFKYLLKVRRFLKMLNSQIW